jgi:hypothetical protein
MKLNIVPARTGIQWVKLGIQAFMKQPFALIGLFFMYMAVASIMSWVPLVGPLLAMAIVPAATLGFMAATREAVKGKFPTPLVFLSAFRAGRERLRAMLVLGLIYAACWIAIILVVGLVIELPAAPVKMDGQTPPPAQFINALMLSLVLYLPVSLVFWHAPALVHWHGVSPFKSLFFSAVACFRNLGALIMFGITWLVIFMGMGTVVSLIAIIAGSPGVTVGLAMPFALLMTAVFFTSLYFTFRDSFVAEPDAEQQPPGEPT